MSKTLIIGDTHIDEASINEIEAIFEAEVFPLASVCQRVIQLGDYYDKNKPTPLELKYGTNLAKRLKELFGEVVIISGTGEHDLFHDTSVIEYLEAVGAKTIKGDYIKDNILYGHFMTNESRFEYGTAKHTVSELSKYKYVFLGHQHNPQDITNKIFHVGSMRYVNFNEVDDTKRIFVLDDSERIDVINLISPISMIDVYDVADLEKLTARMKVRYVCESFEDFRKNASTLNKLGKKFVQFKIKLNFKDEAKKELIASKVEAKSISKDEIIKAYIDKIEDKEVAKLLKEIINEN